MTVANGWGWIEAGQGSTSPSQVPVSLQESPMAVTQPEPVVPSMGFVDELHQMKNELDLCRSGHCEAAYRENGRGGEARGIVSLIGRAVGVQLGDNPRGGQIWSPENMTRVLEQVQALAQEVETLRHEYRTISATVQDRNGKTLAALREAMVHLDGVM